jgi:hypothetical protein
LATTEQINKEKLMGTKKLLPIILALKIVSCGTSPTHLEILPAILGENREPDTSVANSSFMQMRYQKNLNQFSSPEV